MRVFKRAGKWYLDVSTDGRRIRKLIKGARTRSEAQAALAAVKTDVLRGTYKFKNSNNTRLFQDMVAEYLIAKAQKRSLKEDEKLFKTFSPEIENRFLDKITPADIEVYKSKRLRDGLSGATVNRGLSLLKHLFNLAIKKGYLDRNPVKEVEFCREGSWRHKYVLSGAEIHRLMDAAAPHLRPILVVAFGTGLRRGDILNLKWENIDFERRLISITMQKTEDLIEIPMLPMVEAAFRSLKVEAAARSNAGEAPFPYVFVSIRPDRHKHEFTKIVDLKTGFHAALRRAGLADKGYRFHDIRRTFASTLANGGVALTKVQRLLGHRSVTTTERYLNVKLEEKRQAVMLLDSIWGNKLGSDQIYGTDVAQGELPEPVTCLLPNVSQSSPADS